MQKVMNNYDLRREIWTFLRKEPKKKCFKCNCVLVWDKQIKKHYSISHYYGQENVFMCYDCVPTYNLPTCSLV